MSCKWNNWQLQTCRKKNEEDVSCSYSLWPETPWETSSQEPTVYDAHRSEYDSLGTVFTKLWVHIWLSNIWVCFCVYRFSKLWVHIQISYRPIFMDMWVQFCQMIFRVHKLSVSVTKLFVQILLFTDYFSSLLSAP